MSKADIINVATLSAHLAYLVPDADSHPQPWMARQAVKDAMALQRLGRSATSNATRLCNIPNYQEKHDKQAGRIHAKAQAILKPYGLKCTVGGDPRGYCLHILGLPGNTGGEDQEGFGI